MRVVGGFKLAAAAATIAALLSNPAAAGLEEGLRAFAAGDDETAVTELTPLAKNGDSVAQFHLWLVLRERNFLRGLSWLMKAADQGHPQAEADLGDVYRLGRGQRKDYAKARDLYRRAADEGEAGGLKGLGDLYRDGLGVARDPERAQKLYQHAIDLGSTEARVAMGDLYRDGVLGAPDEAQARAWYRQAAELGDQSGRDRIAEMDAKAAAAEAEVKAKAERAAGAPPASTGGGGAAGGGAVVVTADTAEAQRVADRLLLLFNSYPKVFGLTELGVVDAGSHFEVEITGLRYGASDTGYLDVPRLAFSIEPQGAGLYRVGDLEAPSDMVVRDRSGAETGRLLATVTRFSGLLVLDIPLFIDSDIEIRDIRVAVPAEGLLANISRVELKSVGQLDRDGRWNIDGDYRVSDVRIAGTGGERVDVAELRYESLIAGFDVAAYARLVGEFKRAMGAAGSRDLPQRLAARLANEPGYVGDVKAGLTVTGLAVGVPGASVRLNEFKLSGEATKVREPLFDFALRISEDGLAIGGADDPDTVRLIQVLPQSSRLNLIVTALPKEAFGRAFLRYVGTVFGAFVAQPELTELYALMAIQQFGEELLQAMGAAGTTIRLVDTAYQAPIIAVNVAADFRVDAAAPQGLVGALTIAVVGLDQAIALAQSDPSTASPPGMMDALRAASERTRAADGTVVDTFVVRLAADGSVTVNGRPYQTLMGTP